MDASIALSTLLRGFSQLNEMPMLFASPNSIIENSRENFFKAVGDYPFTIWGDERDEPFKVMFEKNFLSKFYMYEINYETPDAFYLYLGNFLQRKMPIYCRSWRVILDEMYITSTGNTQGNVKGKTVNQDQRNTDSWGKSTTESESNSIAKDRGVNNDLPQSKIDFNVNLDNVDYASTANNSEHTSNSTTTSETNSEDHSKSVGNATGTSESDSISNNQARTKDVFEIYHEWIVSGYDLFTPVFKDMMKEQLFLGIL